MSSIEFDDIRSLLDAAEAANDSDAWRKSNLYTPFVDTLGELSTWHCYSAQYLKEKQKQRDLDENPGRAFNYIATNQNRSVGRNDPCPCGSGKKYKKCCLQDDAA